VHGLQSCRQVISRAFISLLKIVQDTVLYLIHLQHIFYIWPQLRAIQQQAVFALAGSQPRFAPQSKPGTQRLRRASRMEAVAKARLAAGLPALRPDGSPYVRGPYKPRAPKGTSAAGGGKEERQKSGRQPQQPDQKVPGSASYVAQPICPEALTCEREVRRCTVLCAESSVLVAPCCRRVEPRAGSIGAGSLQIHVLPSVQVVPGYICICGAGSIANGADWTSCSACKARFHAACCPLKVRRTCETPDIGVLLVLIIPKMRTLVVYHQKASLCRST